MPETQTCPECGRTWEYTALKSVCPKCDVKTIVDYGGRKPGNTTLMPAVKGHAEIEHEFSGLRDKLRRGKDAHTP